MLTRFLDWLLSFFCYYNVSGSGPVPDGVAEAWTVLVERDGTGPLSYENLAFQDASDKVVALCREFGCRFSEDEQARILTVHARSYHVWE